MCVCVCVCVCVVLEVLGWEGRDWALATAATLALALDSMQELCEEMKLLACDLQDNNRIIEG